MIRIDIPGEPYALKRHQHLKRGGTYDPESNKQAKARIAAAAREVMGAAPLIEGPVKLSVIACYQWPKSTTKKVRARPNGFYRHARPDLDNVIKAVMDALNGVVWHDDGQVAAIYAEKIHTTTDQATRLTIEPLWRD